MKRSVRFITFLLSLILILGSNNLSVTAVEQGSAVPDKELIVNVVGIEADGDCIIIQYGDTQIMIDSASGQGTAETTIKNKITDIMTSDAGKLWDYMIFTHPDEDHIGNAEKIFKTFESNTGWKIGTIIDYDFPEAKDDVYNTVAKNYRIARNKICQEKGTDYFAASTLSENSLVKEYRIDEWLKIDILYNYYDNYQIASGGKAISGDSRNLMSVCCLITFGNQKLFFTGDLLRDGEEKLLLYHKDLIKNVTLFKAAHHGSKSSNTEKFIDCIRPVYVAITKMNSTGGYVGSSMDSFLKYTDYIYITYIKAEKNYQIMHGDIIFRMDGKNVYVDSEIDSNQTCIRDLKWFKDAVECYEEDANQINDRIFIITFDEDEYSSHNNCTLIKYGHIDILIDCGSMSNSARFVEKLRDYVVDGEIEYVIVTNHQYFHYNQLIGDYKDGNPVGNGILDEFIVDNLIDGGVTVNTRAPVTGYYPKYNERIKEIDGRQKVGVLDSASVKINDNLSFQVMGSGVASANDEGSLSLITLVKFRDDKYLFVGDQVYYEYIIEKYGKELKGVSFMRHSGSAVNIKSVDYYEDFIKKADPKYSVVGTPIDFVLSNGKTVYGENNRITLLNNVTNSRQIFFCGYMNGTSYVSRNGDIIFCSDYHGGYYNYSVKSARTGQRPYPLSTIDNY